MQRPHVTMKGLVAFLLQNLAHRHTLFQECVALSCGRIGARLNLLSHNSANSKWNLKLGAGLERIGLVL